MARAQLCHEIWHDVVVGAGDQPQRNAFPVEGLLQLRGGRADLRARIMVQARKDVRRTGSDRLPRQPRRLWPSLLRRKIGCAVVDAGEDVAMQVDHSRCLGVVG